MTGSRVADSGSALAPRLSPLLERARRRAETLRRPVLACLTLAWQGGETSLDLVAAGSRRFSFWSSASRRTEMLFIDEAVAVAASGRSRFRALREQTARLFGEAVVDGPRESSAPFCFAGFAFDPEAGGDPLWRGFEDGAAFVPRYVLCDRDGYRTMTLSLLVASSIEPAYEASRLAEDAERLLGSAVVSASPPQHSGATHVDVDEAEARLRWCDNVRALTGAIERGEVDKVVLARRLELQRGGGFSLDAVRARLHGRYAACTIFAAGGPDACFIGATPEMLVDLDGGIVRADCLAGTARRGATPREDEAIGAALLDDDKELREHAFVRDFQLQALAGLCEVIDAPRRPALKRMANLQHLHTPLRATPRRGVHVLDFVEALHPTPATAGTPGAAALRLIRRHEDFGRGWYAGPLGWLDAAGNGSFAVALRSALIQGERASLFAGCGIVAGSDPDREFEESQIKLQAMTWALGADNLSPGADGQTGKRTGP